MHVNKLLKRITLEVQIWPLNKYKWETMEVMKSLRLLLSRDPVVSCFRNILKFKEPILNFIVLQVPGKT